MGNWKIVNLWFTSLKLVSFFLDMLRCSQAASGLSLVVDVDG